MSTSKTRRWFWRTLLTVVGCILAVSLWVLFWEFQGRAKPPDPGWGTERDGLIPGSSKKIRGTDLNTLRASLQEARSFDRWFLHDLIDEIANRGSDAHALGADLLPWLRPLDWDQGERVAVALARIDYRDAIPQLIDATRTNEDWALVAGACEALGRLRANEAEPALQHVANSHWYEPVRRVAKRALRSLRGESVPTASFGAHYRYPESELPLEAEPRAVSELAWPQSGVRAAVRRSWVRQLAPAVDEVLVEKPDGTFVRRKWHDHPVFSLRLAGGVLLGYDRGEFASGLVFVPPDGPAQLLVFENVSQFVRRQDGVLVVTWQPMTDDCMLWLVREVAPGKVEARPYCRPPDRVHAGVEHRDGSLVFHGVFRLTPEGIFQAVEP